MPCLSGPLVSPDLLFAGSCAPEEGLFSSGLDLQKGRPGVVSNRKIGRTVPR
jgi:hypothetical protein